MSRLAIVVMGMMACSGQGSDVAFDAPPIFFDAPPTRDGPVDARDLQTCLAIREQWRAKVVTLGGACDSDTDCAALGGFRHVGCVSAMLQMAEAGGSDCSGVAVNAVAAAAAGPELAALEAAFFDCLGTRICTTTLPDECVFDCLSGSIPACNTAHQCGLRRESAGCTPPRDAG